MPRNILVVNDGRLLARAINADESYKEICWSDFSPELLGTSGAELLILAGECQRLRRVDWLHRALERERCKVLVLLPQDSNRDDIDFALSIADDLALLPEREDVLRLRVRRLLGPAV